MAFWPLTNSDFPTDQTFHQFHDLYTELDLHRIMSGFHGAFATGVASQQGTLTLPDTWFRPPFLDLLLLQLLRPDSSNLPCLYSTFHLEYPLVLSRFCYHTGDPGSIPRRGGSSEKCESISGEFLSPACHPNARYGGIQKGLVETSELSVYELFPMTRHNKELVEAQPCASKSIAHPPAFTAHMHVYTSGGRA